MTTRFLLSATMAMRLRGERGLGLVELMVAIALSLGVLLTLGYLFVGGRQTYRVQDGLARIQENARYAIEIISRDLRMAGYFGCSGSLSGVVLPTGSPAKCSLQPGAICNTLNNPSLFGNSYGASVQGYDAGGSVWSPALPVEISAASPLAGRDILAFRGVRGGGVPVTDHPGGNPPGSADLKIEAPNTLSVDDIVLVTDCSQGAIFQITNFNVTGTAKNVVHNEGAGKPGNATKALGKEFKGGELMRMTSSTYFIRNGAGGRPALWRLDNARALGGDNPAELVEGVEDMQLAYGVDSDGDRQIDSYLPASGVTDWTQVRSVRVNLLMASVEPNLAMNPQKIVFNDGIDDHTVNLSDRRLGYAISTTIALRNRLQ